MATIDADAHVIECDDTWTYLAPADRKLLQTVSVTQADGREKRGWVIDGQLRMAGAGEVDEELMPSAAREMRDVAGRVRQMDEIGTDIQVLFPTVFLVPLTSNPHIEASLYRAYNRWLADRVAESPDRLAWAVAVPTLDLKAAREEIEFGKQHGASAVFWRAFEHGRLPSDPYFEPILNEINAADLALCIHAANGTPLIYNAFPSDGGFWRFKIPGITAFHALLSSNLSTTYPNIRFGFVEFQSQWVPYALKDFVRRGEQLLHSHSAKDIQIDQLMADKRIYVACQTDDDVNDVARYAGQKNLIAGTDFGHADTSSELNALTRLRNESQLTPGLADMILDANPRALYALRS